MLPTVTDVKIIEGTAASQGRTAADPAMLLAVAQAAVANAQNYLEEAQWFLRRQRWGRAQTFAILGREELGKAAAYMTIVMLPLGVRSTMLVGKMEHRAKLSIGEMMQAVMSYMASSGGSAAESVLDGIKMMDELTQPDNEAKKQGLYVDYRDEVVHVPGDVTPAQAKKAVEKLREAIKSSPQLTDRGFHSFLLQQEASYSDFMREMRDRMTAIGDSKDEASFSNALTEFMTDVRAQVPERTPGVTATELSPGE